MEVAINPEQSTWRYRCTSNPFSEF